jgi:hypothetical protein
MKFAIYKTGIISWSVLICGGHSGIWFVFGNKKTSIPGILVLPVKAKGFSKKF